MKYSKQTTTTKIKGFDLLLLVSHRTADRQAAGVLEAHTNTVTKRTIKTRWVKYFKQTITTATKFSHLTYPVSHNLHLPRTRQCHHQWCTKSERHRFHMQCLSHGDSSRPPPGATDVCNSYPFWIIKWYSSLTDSMQNTGQQAMSKINKQTTQFDQLQFHQLRLPNHTKTRKHLLLFFNDVSS